MNEINTSSQKTIKDSFYNVMGFILPIVILIIYTPIIIHHLGVEIYGVYVFLNTLLAFISLLDLGIGIATNKHIVEYLATNQLVRLQKLLRSMNTVYLMIGCVYFIICVSIGFFLEFFWTSVGNQENYLILLLIIGATGFMYSVFSNFGNSLVALQRYDIQIKISSFYVFLSNTLILLLVLNGYKLIPILIGQFFISIFLSLTYVFFSKKIFSLLELKYEWHLEEIKTNYKYALPIAFNNIASSSLVHFDKILIPAFLGSAPLTFYSVPGSISTKISSLSGTLSSLLFPITVNLNALGDLEKIKRVYLKSFRLLAVLAGSITISIIFNAHKILFFWLGNNFAQNSFYVLILLSITHFILALLSPLSNLLMAMNKMKFLTFGTFAMAALNLVSLIIFLPLFGINGAALSYLISVMVALWMLWYSEKFIFLIKVKSHYFVFLKLLATSLPFYFLTRIVIHPLIQDIYTLAILGPLSVVIFLIMYRLFGFFENDDWNEFEDLFQKKISTSRIQKNNI